MVFILTPISYFRFFLSAGKLVRRCVHVAIPFAACWKKLNVGEVRVRWGGVGDGAGIILCTLLRRSRAPTHSLPPII